MMEKEYLTVLALTKYIKRKFEVDPHLQSVYVKGEISNLKQHQSGHVYFTLKDEGARIAAVMFAKDSKNIRFKLENGLKVLIRGDISLFESTGQYQIYVKEMQPDGIGELYLAYEQLKEKLANKGYFEQKNKKLIPAFPHTIGVITSPTGAAVRDIITTLNRRYPLAKVIVFPAIVQGVNAAPSIVKHIQNAQKYEIDCLIVGRGGGSIEELWAFNEETVAEAVFNCPIPIISAVGHETDFTICDFVADLRAPTPTAAAELAVPNIQTLNVQQLEYQMRIVKAMQRHLIDKQNRLSKLNQSYAFRYPYKMYEMNAERLDILTEKLSRIQTNFFEKKKEAVQDATYRLMLRSPSVLVEKQKQKHNQLSKDLYKAMNLNFMKYTQAFVSNVEKLEAYSPLKVMARGYSISYNEKNELIRSIQQVEKKEMIKVTLMDGELHCQIQTKEERNNNE